MKKIVFALIFLGMAACKKEEDPSFGPQVEPELVEKIQGDALSGSDPATIRTGDFVHILSTQEVYSGGNPSRLLLEEEGITISDRQEISDCSIITVIREVLTHSVDGNSTNKFEDNYALPAASNPDACKNLIASMKQQAAEAPPASTQQEPKVTLTYHNLITRKEKIARPAPVEQRYPCPAEQDCRLNATHIFYDVVVHTEGEPSRKNQIELLISADTPYFGNILKNCLTTVASVGDARPLVRQCKTVYDYEWGASTP